LPEKNTSESRSQLDRVVVGVATDGTGPALPSFQNRVVLTAEVTEEKHP
jgi:hypothetical protein